VQTAFITGIGIISPIGCDAQSVLKSLRQLRDGLDVATKIDASPFAGKICGEVRGFDCASNMSARELEIYTDPFIRYALNAARMALRDAGLGALPKRTAAVLASCNAGMNSGEREYAAKYGASSAIFDRNTAEQSEFYALCKAVSSAVGVEGECFMINTACSGSTAAVGLAEALVESGEYDCVLAGGSDAMSLANYAGFSAIKVVSPEKIAPFSTPVGMNLGEGAAFWVIESESRAEARGAKVYGKVIGRSTSGDAHHPTQPDPRGDGAYRTMRAAAENAGIEVSQIGCINAHGSGTAANDKAESKGIAKFLCGARVPITSTKSYTGHCMGATGIIEATCQLLSMNDNFIPPTLRNSGARPGCEIEAVGGAGIEGGYSCFLSANYAFAGNNAAIVVAKRDFSDYKKKPPRENARAAITGAGAITSLGVGFEENLASLSRGESGVRPIGRFASDRMAGLAALPNLRSFDRRIDFGGMNSISAFATIAAKLALDGASIRVGRDNAEDVGIAVSTCRGSSEEAHMKGVFAYPDRRGDIACFSNVTANSTAGWVTKALGIKGANITLASGPNSGIQTLAYAARVVKDGLAKAVVAETADELYAQMLECYGKIGALHEGAVERDFHLNYSSYYKSVMGDGAVAAVVEDYDFAKARGAEILGEILSYASTCDVVGFGETNLLGAGLEDAARRAIDGAGISPADIDLFAWGPSGCAHDAAAIRARDRVCAGTPMVATSLHTGYMETGSAVHALLCVLESAAKKIPLWRQRTGVRLLDAAPLPENPRRILCAGSSRTGGNYAVVVGR